jgi:hypothetical protein
MWPSPAFAAAKWHLWCIQEKHMMSATPFDKGESLEQEN